MTKTFKVTIEYKRGHEVASAETLENAIAFTDPTNESYKNVRVEVMESVHTEVKTEYMKPLYALGRKSGKGWKLIDFFNSQKKAANALKKSVYNYLGCFMKGEFAVLSYCPSLGVWRVEGKSVKV